jgi:hypothetical protein
MKITSPVPMMAGASLNPQGHPSRAVLSHEAVTTRCAIGTETSRHDRVLMPY